MFCSCSVLLQTTLFTFSIQDNARHCSQFCIQFIEFVSVSVSRCSEASHLQFQVDRQVLDPSLTTHRGMNNLRTCRLVWALGRIGCDSIGLHLGRSRDAAPNLHLLRPEMTLVQGEGPDNDVTRQSQVQNSCAVCCVTCTVRRVRKSRDSVLGHRSEATPVDLQRNTIQAHPVRWLLLKTRSTEKQEE